MVSIQLKTITEILGILNRYYRGKRTFEKHIGTEQEDNIKFWRNIPENQYFK